MKFFKRFDLLVSLTVIFISFYLVIRWLPAGTIIAGGDVGIPHLLPQKQLGDVISSWWDSHGTGVSSPTTYTSISYYLFLSLLDNLGLTPDITQKLVFFLILISGALSIYFLGLNFSLNKWTSYLASIFYIFNLTSLSVWQRGVHNAMLMLLLAPLSLLILVWGIKNRKYSSIILINITSFLLSYVFGALGYLFSIWLLWTVYIAIVLFEQWKDKSARKFILSYYFILLFSWIGTNLWWIIHFLQSSNYALGQLTPEELKSRGSDVLVGLRTYLEPSVILRGLSKFYHYDIKVWGDIYLNSFFLVLSWIPTLIIFSTTLVKSNYKSASWRFLFSLTIIVLIISKGVNPPLGVLNKIPYDLFPFLAPLRNPYEKVGILLTIPFSLLFALGIDQINSYFKLKEMGYMRWLMFLVVVACLTVLVWPLWLGKLFSSEGKKYTHTIPPFYAEASKWIAEKTKVDDTRILHLPLAWWESVDYNWGYTGIEPSQSFFEGSSIGYHIGIPSVDSRIRDLLLLMHNQDTQNLQKAFASLNIGWVIIHNETLFRDRMLEPPERINNWLATNPYFLDKVTSFGPLDIWRVKDEYRVGHFYSAGKLINLKNTPALTPQKIWGYIDKLNDSFITETQTTKESELEKFVDRILIFSNPNAIKPVGEAILSEESGKNLTGNTFSISDIDVRAFYQISFDVLSDDGSSIFMTIAHDNDPLDRDGRIKPAIVKEIKPQSFMQWQKTILNYSPPLNATSAQISFVKTSDSSAAKNLKVEKIIAQEPIQEDQSSSSQKLGGVKVKWNKINPTTYSLNLSEQIPPYILIFSETFHPLWQIADFNGKKIDLSHFSINGYANGWLVERPLPEKIKVEFSLQRVFAKGVVAALVSFVISAVILFYLDYKKRLR